MNLYKYSSPATFYPLAAVLWPWFAGVAALLAIAGLYIGLFVAPTDFQQGEVYRVIFIHVPAAWMGMFIYLVMAGYGVLTLAFNTRLSAMMMQALAPTGAMFTALALWTGALWGKPTWGTYWVWDARMTSTLILLFLYIGFMALGNAIEDRHPDHGRSAKLVEDAAFLSGLARIETTDNGVKQEAWRPKYVLHYIQDRYLEPDFVIDISDVFERKIEAIKAYKTQFHNPDVDGPQTYISTPEFLDSVIYRYKMFGKMIGVKYAEGFISEKMIGFKSLDVLIKENT